MLTANRPPSRKALLGVAAVAIAVPLAAACGTGSSGAADKSESSSGSAKSVSDKPAESKVSISSNVAPGAKDVQVNRLVALKAADGTFRTVEVKTLKGAKVPGAMNADRTAWHASGLLESGRKYKVHAVAADTAGVAKTYDARFDAKSLTKDEQTYPSVSPLGGQTVGVAMPVAVHFDVAVKNRAAFERRMHVTSTSGQKGSWYWIDGNNAHYRPRHYWKPGSKVTVALDLKSVDAGNDIFGQMDRKMTFDVGRSMVSKVNTQSDQMKVFRGGSLVRTLPVTTGQQPKYTTRSGTKVIIEKDRRHDMNSETIGIDPNGPEGYNLSGVEFAMRLTNSGEFLHAAPWSVGSQGHSNVSHGCTGLSTSNAGWLYNNSMIGDPVEYTGTTKAMTLTNGYGDWNLSWSDWKKGSAI